MPHAALRTRQWASAIKSIGLTGSGLRVSPNGPGLRHGNGVPSRDQTHASLKPCRSKGGGLVGNGCVGQASSTGTVDFGTGRSSIEPDRLPSDAFEYIKNSGLILRDYGFNPLVMHGDIAPDGRRCGIVLAEMVMKSAGSVRR